MRVWKQARKTHLSAQDVRRSLTQGSIPANHRLAAFVGIDAYVAAGGAVARDLFDTSNTGFLIDSTLLMQLVSQKLETAEEAVRLEGWKWVRAELEADYITAYRYVYPKHGEGDEESYAPEDMAKAGAILRIAHDGTLDVRRGHVHPGDWKQQEGTAKPKAVKPAAEKGEYAATVVEDLSAHKTAALRIELARNPDVALASTVHAMAMSLFANVSGSNGCLDIKANSEALPPHVKELGDCSAHEALQQEIALWKAVMPLNSEERFAWCLSLPQVALLDLLAVLAACTVNAVQLKGSVTSSRIAHSEALASALTLDMAKHWRGSEEGFYNRLPKAGLAFAVCEAKAPIAASVLSMKKPDAARYVRQAMEGTGWLPAPLRTATDREQAEAA